MRTLEAVPDTELRYRVVKAIETQPEIVSADISVAVQDGVATLTGFVHSYFAKLAAEEATKQVPGSQGLANDIQVKLGRDASDPELARQALRTLKEQLGIAGCGLQITVRNGLLTLEGSVDTYRQKRAAEDAIMTIPGAKGLISRLDIRG